MDCSPPGSSLSMGFSRQEYWNGLPFPAPGDLFNSGIKCTCAALQVDSFPLSHQGSPYIASVQFSSVAQSCQTLCDPMDCSPPGSSLSMEFSRQEHWSGLPFSFPEDLPNPGIELMSPVSSTLTDRFFTTKPPGKPV